MFITEYMSSGSLKQFLRKTKKNNRKIQVQSWKRWCTQILSALKYGNHTFIIEGNVVYWFSFQLFACDVWSSHSPWKPYLRYHLYSAQRPRQDRLCGSWYYPPKCQNLQVCQPRLLWKVVVHSLFSQNHGFFTVFWAIPKKVARFWD